MKISDAIVKLLNEYSVRPVSRNVHPEDLTIYNNGLTDGVTILSQEILAQLKPDEGIPTEPKESE